MSYYSFIAADYEMPEVDKTNGKYITVQEAIALGSKAFESFSREEIDPNEKILYFENEDDLFSLVISKGNPEIEDINWYTERPFVYSLDFRYSDVTIKQLFEYLKENIRVGQRLELWFIWLGDKQFSQPTICRYQELSLEPLKKLFNLDDEKFAGNGCIIIERL